VSPSPIIEAVTEIRFENNLPSAVLFGTVYSAFSTEFPETEQLPILEMPQQFRDAQPELDYAPHYRLKNEKFLINVGQKSISINRLCTKHEYKDWREYSTVIKRVFEEVEKAGFFTQVERTSVRYINFFENQTDEALNLEIKLFREALSGFEELNVGFIKTQEAGKLSVGIAINVKVDYEGTAKRGLVLNLEAFEDTTTDLSEVKNLIDSLHVTAEDGFFNALTEATLTSLNPVYE